MSMEVAHVALQTPLTQREIADLHQEIIIGVFHEVLTEVEAAYADLIAQEPKPHTDKLRLELHASLHTLRTVLDLSGLRMAERLSLQVRTGSSWPAEGKT